MRSKSELVIAEHLNAVGIAYQYERKLEGSKRPGPLRPDFSFADDAGSMEHALCAEKRASAKLKRANWMFRSVATLCEHGSKRSCMVSFYW